MMGSRKGCRLGIFSSPVSGCFRSILHRSILAASGVVELGVHSASAAGASSSDTVPDWSQRQDWNHVRPGRCLDRSITVLRQVDRVSRSTNLAPMALPLSERSTRSIGAVCDVTQPSTISAAISKSRAVIRRVRFRRGRLPSAHRR
jgi:hypothetical protein